MSLPVNPDGSTQPTLTFTTVSTPETLNIWQKSSTNVFYTDIGNVGIGTTTNINFKLKVNGSVNATAFNGDGANITNVPFSTITGKPTSYQADWNSTVINKPSTFPADMTNIYTKTETNNLLDTKQAIINTYSITGGTGGSLSFTSGTLTLAVPNNYTQNMSISNLITPTSFIYKGTELSTTIEPLQNIWTKIGNNIYNTAQYNGKVGIGITNPSTMLEIARLDVSANKIKFGHEGRYAVNQLFCNFFFRFITSHTASDEIAYFGYVDSYEDPLNRTMVLGITRTTLNMTGDIYASGNVGIGVSASATYKCNINGSLNATSFFQNGTQIDFNSYATNNNLTTNYYNKTETNNLLSAKDAILSFTSPLVRTTNTITFNESAITTLTNFYNKNDADNRYLQLSGGTLTGDLQISKSNPILTIRAGGESETAILYISTPFNSTSALKTAIISEGSTGWSRSKLHFCLNNTPTGAPGTTNWNLSTYTTTIADARMTIIPAGNVGISNTNPIARLHITETTGTTNGANTGTIILDHNNHGGASCITFRSAINRGSDYGYIQYQDSSIIDGAGESAKLIIGTQNDNDDDILLLPSGNVGIATTNTSSNKLYVNGSAYINGLLTINNDILLNRTNGHIQFGATNGNNLALPSGDGFFSSSALAGDMVLRSINRLHLLSGSGASAITINTNNNVGIGITNSFAPLCIGSPLVNGSDGHLVLSKRNLAGNAFRNFRMGIDDNFFFCIGDFGFGVSGNNWRPSDFTINYINGNIGMGTSNQSYKLAVNGSINSTSLWQNGTQIDFNSYLLKSGGTMTGQLILTFDNNPLRIKSTLTGANNSIQILNNIDKTAYIGVGGSGFGGNYQNNFFIESATGSIILNTSGRTSGSVPNMIINDTGNVGIATTNPNTLLDIYNATNPKIYLNTAGTTRCFLSGNSSGLDLGNDVGTGKYIRFMPDNVERVRINSDGKIGFGVNNTRTNFEIYGTNPSMCIRAANEGETSTLFLGTGFGNTGAYKAAIIAQGISNWSRSYLHFCLDNSGDNTYPTYNAGLNNIRMTIRPDGNFNFYPDPFTINNQNNVSYSVNLNAAANTTATPALSTFLKTEITDGWNAINTRVTLACSGSANSGYNNGSRIILDGSFGINGTGTTNSIIRFQSQATNGSWVQNAYLRTLDNSITFRCEGNISCFSLTQTSSSNIKTDIQPINNPLNIITQLNGHYYSNIKTNDYEYGLIAEEVDDICPCIVDKSIDDMIGIKYNSLIPILIESIKTLNYKIENLQEKLSALTN